MDQRHVTPRSVRSAFRARASGAASPELIERIRAGVRTTAQVRHATATTALTLLAVLGLLAAMAVRLGGQTASEVALDPGATPTRSALAVTPTGTEPTAPVSAGASTPAPATPSSSTETLASTEAPSADPSLDPGVSATAEVTPEAVPTRPPDAVTYEPGPLRVDGTGHVVATGGLRLRSEPTVAEHSMKGQLLAEGVRFVIIDGPRAADGYVWWYIHHLDGPDRRPDGWVAEAGRDGQQWIAGTSPVCPPEASWAVLDSVPWQLRATCFGSHDITLTGSILCSSADAQGGVIVGPSWLDVRTGCGLVNGGHRIGVTGRPWMEAVSSVGPPLDAPVGRWSVTGHVDDPEAGACRWQSPEPEPPAYAVWYCRGIFVATEVTRID